MRRNDKLIHKKINECLVRGVLMVVAMQLGNIVDYAFLAYTDMGMKQAT